MSKIAFLILDFQNDQCHEDGVFFKNGLFSKNIPKIYPNICKVANFCKENKLPIIAMQLTILENSLGNALGLGIHKTIRPFLEKEGLRFGSWGHDLVDGLPKVDFNIKRFTISSFYQTELERHLNALDIDEIVLCGFTTNGIVETTAREAVGRNYLVTTLTDCTASYSDALHESSLSNLSSFGKILTSEKWIENYKNLKE
ncbi:MAG: Isochorismatase family protein YecD [Candidatus Anoxychlamydiales bacterium]|nr:Isochorismatase family protein YecD [Candidatus Anoxychlamydiales bacterium]